MNVKSESPNKLKAAKCHSFTLSCPCVWGGHRGTPRYQCQWDPDFSGELQVIKHFCESALLYTLCILRPQERTDLGHSRIRCNGNAHWLLGDGPNKSAEKAGGKEQHLQILPSHPTQPLREPRARWLVTSLLNVTPPPS